MTRRQNAKMIGTGDRLMDSESNRHARS